MIVNYEVKISIQIHVDQISELEPELKWFAICLLIRITYGA